MEGSTTVTAWTADPQPRRQNLRLSLGGGAATTMHVIRFPRWLVTARVVAIEPHAPLLEWCERNGADHAVIGGFYVRSDGTPLGDLVIDGQPCPSVPFSHPWNKIRSCVHVSAGDVALASRAELPAKPAGDLLQAGPMLVRGGVKLIKPGVDPEGFSAGSAQFDSDITAGRYPRAALGLNQTDLIAVVSEGRSEDEAGLTLAETAKAMLHLGATHAINLDGGGSASLVVGRRLVNTPREEEGDEIPGGRPICTALQFVPR
jgi:exopolysaccharide biosynthesis protein